MSEKIKKQKPTIYETPISTFMEERKREVMILKELDLVEEVLHEIWFSCNLIDFVKNKPLKSTTELFISTYFMRNIIYLYSAYECAYMGNTMPSYNLQRTVLETIIKSYIYIVDEKVADKCYITTASYLDSSDRYRNYFIHKIIDKNNLEKFFIDCSKKIIKDKIKESDRTGLIRKINYYSKFENNVDLLYNDDLKNDWMNLYGRICKAAHPSVDGVYSDLLLNLNKVKECLEFVLILCYMNMVIFLEIFYDDADDKLKEIYKSQLQKIHYTLNKVPSFVPNKKEHKNILNLDEDYKNI